MEVIVIRPKTIRLRDTDWDDLRYLVAVSAVTEGEVLRTLIAVVAQTLRAQVVSVRPEVTADPQWGATIVVEEPRLWTPWLAARHREAQSASEPPMRP